MNNLGITNFRCFENYTITFKRGVNLLIGDNASGKTSLLTACKYVLSSFFAGFSDENTRWETPSNDEFHTIEENDLTSKPGDIDISFDLYPELFGITENHDLAYLFPTSRQSIQKKSTKNSRPLVSELKQYKVFSAALKDTALRHVSSTEALSCMELPLFAAFTTEDIHSTKKETISMDKFKSYAPLRSFGYYECLNNNGLLKYWCKRLLVLAEAGRGEIEMTVVKKAVEEALGKKGCDIIDGLNILPIRGAVYVTYTDGRKCNIEALSDGYKRLLNMVITIAERCAILNGCKYGNLSAHETSGTILIDEIDMHLHPTLQACVLKGLQCAFPKMQFIVSTHAPMVMTGVGNDPNNIVYKLSYSKEENKYLNADVNTYGLDASTILSLVLKRNPRNENMQKLLDQLFVLIDDNKLAEAKVLQEDIRTINPTLPELTEANTMIELTQALNEED